MDDGEEVYLWNGKKQIGVRTLSIGASHEWMTNKFDVKPKLYDYYNWSLYVEDAKAQEDAKVNEDQVVRLDKCEAHDVAQHMYDNLNCQKVLVEAGPATVHK